MSLSTRQIEILKELLRVEVEEAKQDEELDLDYISELEDMAEQIGQAVYVEVL